MGYRKFDIYQNRLRKNSDISPGQAMEPVLAGHAHPIGRTDKNHCVHIDRTLCARGQLSVIDRIVLISEAMILIRV